MEHVFNLRSNTCICIFIVSSVYRCLEPVMKHLPSFLKYYVKHSIIANITAFFLFFSFSILIETGGRLKFAKVLTFRLRSIRCACKRFDGDCKNYHPLAHPKKVSRLQENIFGGLKKKTLWSCVNVLSRNQNVWWSQNVWSRTRLKF